MQIDKSYLKANRETHALGDDVLRVGAFTPHCRSLGPGLRAVLWVTGCNRRCPGCIKPEFLSFQAGDKVHIDDIGNWIADNKMINGLTISGGEPFEQARSLTKLCIFVRNLGLDIWVFTGFRIEDLLKDSDCKNLLEQVDVVVDGEFKEELATPSLYRGSINQRILRKSPQNVFLEESYDGLLGIQIAMTDQSMRISGFPVQEFENGFREALGKRGLELQSYRGKRSF